MAARAERELERPVIAAINGDFFSFDPPGVPQGPQIQNGRVLKSEGDRHEALESRKLPIQPVFGVVAEGRPFISRVSTWGSLELPGGYTASVQQINAPVRSASLQLYTSFFGDATPPDSGGVEIVVRGVFDQATTHTSQGVILEIDTLVTGVPLSQGTAVFAGRGKGALFLRAFAQLGDTIHWQVHIAGAPNGVAELIGGFPVLLQGGQRANPPVGEMALSFSEKRHPRSAVGWHPDGTVFLVAVDGRQPGYSEGMTLNELAAFLEGLGITEAVNLDGGGSTTLAVRGIVANRPSDEEGERAVANALLVLGPEPGECSNQ